MNSQSLLLDIKNLVCADLDSLELEIKNIFFNQSKMDNDLFDYICAPAKRLRPMLGFLFLRAIFGEISDEQKKILLAVEIIHNATLIHDDVIDEADERRGQESLNAKFNKNLAVVAGDFLLSVALEKIAQANSIDVLNVFSSALKSTCIGEINQYFSKYKVPTIDEYLEKSRLKTAILFHIGIKSGILLSSEKSNNNLLQLAQDFSENFGIAFQIRDDLLNILNNGNDIQGGIYTAPVIFAVSEIPDIIDRNNILDELKNTSALENTKNLMDNYFNKALHALSNIQNGVYKDGLIQLIESLRVEL